MTRNTDDETEEHRKARRARRGILDEWRLEEHEPSPVEEAAARAHARGVDLSPEPPDGVDIGDFDRPLFDPVAWGLAYTVASDPRGSRLPETGRNGFEPDDRPETTLDMIETVEVGYGYSEDRPEPIEIDPDLLDGIRMARAADRDASGDYPVVRARDRLDRLERAMERYREGRARAAGERDHSAFSVSDLDGVDGVRDFFDSPTLSGSLYALYEEAGGRAGTTDGSFVRAASGSIEGSLVERVVEEAGETIETDRFGTGAVRDAIDALERNGYRVDDRTADERAVCSAHPALFGQLAGDFESMDRRSEDVPRAQRPELEPRQLGVAGVEVFPDPSMPEGTAVVVHDDATAEPQCPSPRPWLVRDPDGVVAVEAEEPNEPPFRLEIGDGSGLPRDVLRAVCRPGCSPSRDGYERVDLTGVYGEPDGGGSGTTAGEEFPLLSWLSRRLTW